MKKKKITKGSSPVKSHKAPKSRKNAAATKRSTIQGSIIIHPRGFGFVNRKTPLDDIFIPKQMVNGAVDGDIVNVEIQPPVKDSKGTEGKVISIEKRSRTQVVGTVLSHHAKTCEVFAPIITPQPYINCSLSKATRCKKGDRVLVTVDQWGTKERPATGKIVKVIGSIDTPADDIPYIIAEAGLRNQFPKEVFAEAKKFGTRIGKKELEGRLNLQTLECVTIDPDTAKDFDDAVSVEEHHGAFRVGVHIADASYYVQEGSALDKEAALRCNSVYFPNMCIPMLPKELSEQLCSLKPNTTRLAVSVFFTIDNTGHTRDWKIERSAIKSAKRFTYKEAKQVLDGTKKSKFAPLLHRMVQVCRLLKLERKRRGSVELYVPELILRIDESGNPTGTELIEYDITHQMIEEFMLKANEIVAIELKNRGKHLSYRVHEEPDSTSLKDFSTLVQAYGFSLPHLPEPHDIQRFFAENAHSPHIPLLAIAYIKSMRLAIYSPENIGHYGLGLEHYCHFTSPIRRYIDIIIHRLLFEKGPTKDALEEISAQASEKERLAARAEGAVLKIKKLRYLEMLRKQDPDRRYKGVITRVKPFGLYFDIQDLMLEGFLHISNLGEDYYVYNDSASKLIGRRYGEEFFSGNVITVRVKDIDLVTQEARWVIDAP